MTKKLPKTPGVLRRRKRFASY